MGIHENEKCFYVLQGPLGKWSRLGDDFDDLSPPPYLFGGSVFHFGISLGMWILGGMNVLSLGCGTFVRGFLLIGRGKEGEKDLGYFPVWVII